MNPTVCVSPCLVSHFRLIKKVIMGLSVGCSIDDYEGSGSYLCVGDNEMNNTPFLVPNESGGEQDGNPDDIGLIVFFVIIILLYLCSCGQVFRPPINRRT